MTKSDNRKAQTYLTGPQLNRMMQLVKDGRDAGTISVFLNAEYGANLHRDHIVYTCGSIGIPIPEEKPKGTEST